MASPLPSVARKSELENPNPPTPLRRFDSANGVKSSSSAPKKMKNLLQVTLESGRAKSDLESVGLKRKKMNARTFKSLFKRQRIKEVVSDVNGKLEGPDKIYQLCSGDDKVLYPESLGKKVVDSDEQCKRLVVKIRDLANNKADAGDMQKSICKLTGNYAYAFGTDVAVDFNHMDNIFDKLSEPPDGQDNFRTTVSSKATLDDSERLSTSYPTAMNLDVPALKISSGLGRSRHGALTSENGEKCRQAKVADMAPPSTKFLEYWVPVQLSDYQLELYCDTLIYYSSALCSYSKSDSIGALSQALLTVRKCCDHPYLVDSSVQDDLCVRLRPSAEILDTGIKSSGKLQLLDAMLRETKNRGLRVLLVFQMIDGPEKASIGNIVEDFICQRFGANTYERVDATVNPIKKQASVNRFNKKETGQFVFLLENRACSTAIKLSSLDLVILYNSEWNPAKDLKALQKISIDSEVAQIKVFRLYSSFTIEERVLVLAKQNLNLDNNLQNLSRSTSDALLMWGASYLFSKFDEYHAKNNNSGLKISSGHFLLNDLVKVFQAVLSKKCEDIDCYPLISKVRMDAGSYITDAPMLGEAKIELKDGVEPHMFWKNLLDGRKPQGKHLRGSCARSLKRILCVEGLSRKSCNKNDYVGNKFEGSDMIKGNMDPGSIQVESTELHATQNAGFEGGLCTIGATNQSQSLHVDSVSTDDNSNLVLGQRSLGDEVDVDVSGERFPLNKQSLHDFLPEELMSLCQVLKLPENVTHTVRGFLEYVIKNHDVSSDSPSIMQAFQLSVCWIGSLISKEKIDKKYSLLLAKTHLDYQCTEVQVNAVYLEMQPLRRMYLKCSENIYDSGKICLLVDEGSSEEPSDVNDVVPQFSSFNLKNLKINIEEQLAIQEHSEVLSELEDKSKRIKKMCKKEMDKLNQKQEEELQDLQKMLDDERLKLEKDNKLELAVIRCIYGPGPVRTIKLQQVDDNFAKKIKEHDLLKDIQLKDLQEKHLAAQDMESLTESTSLAEAIVCPRKIGALNGPQLFGFPLENDAGCSQLNTGTNPVKPDNSVSLSKILLMDQTATDKDVCARVNDVTPSGTLIDAPADSAACNGLSGNLEGLETVDSSNEMVVMALERSLSTPVEPINHLAHSNSQKINSANARTSGEQISEETRLVDVNIEVPTELNKEKSISDEAVEHVDPVEVRDVLIIEDQVGLLNSEVDQRDEPDELSTVSAQHLVSEDETQRSMESSQQQNQDTPSVIILNFSQVEVSSLEAAHIMTGVESNNEAPLTGNSLQPHHVSDNVSVSFSEFSQSEAEHQTERQGKSPTRPADAEETEEHSPESACGEDLQPHNHLNQNPASIANQQSAELCNSLPDNTVMAEAGSTAEVPNLAGLQSHMHVGHVHGPVDLLVDPTQPVTSRNSTPALITEPLQNELEKLRKETEMLQNLHKDLILRLKSDFEKERQELLNQLRTKYFVKLQDAEAEFRAKKNEIDMNQNKVLMSKKLAEAFRSKCSILKPSGFPGLWQAFPSNFSQQLYQPPSIRIPSAGSTCQPPPSQQIAAPFPQAIMHQLPIPSSTRSSSLSSQNVTVPATIRSVPNAEPVFSGTFSRPPVIGSIVAAPNPHVGGDIRSRPPHLQPFRPATAASMAPTRLSPIPQDLPQLILPPPQLVLVSQAPAPLPANVVSQDMPLPQSRQENTINPLPLTSELQWRMNHQSPMNHVFPPLPDVDLSLDSMEPSEIVSNLGSNVQGELASLDLGRDVVCLSDAD